MTFEYLIGTAPHIIKRKLEQLKFLRERPDYHPEPSTFEHIKIVTERLIPTGNRDLIMTGILHDICKFDTVRMNEKTGWPTSPGHDKAASDLILNNPQIMSWINTFGANPITVASLCEHHMRIHEFHNMRPSKQETMRQLPFFTDLEIFGRADNMLEPFVM